MKKKYAMLVPLLLATTAFFAPDLVDLMFPYRLEGSILLHVLSMVTNHVLKSIGLMGCLYYGAWRTLEWAKGIDEKGTDEE